MFEIEQEVMTPKGRGYVLEQDGDTVYVELSNGVEMDFAASLVEDYAAHEAAKHKRAADKAAKVAAQRMEENHRLSLIRRIRLAEVILNNMTPESRKAIEVLATEHLISRSRMIIEEFEASERGE